MTIDEIKAAIAKDNNLPDDVKKTAKEDLNRWLAKIGELYLLSPALEVCSVSLNSNHHIIGDCIEITNIFRLHTILGVKLYATKYVDKYMIYGNALGYKFMELVSNDVYTKIYKPMTTTISEFNIFHPYSY